MPKELIMRGKTASGETETLSFGGDKSDHAYRMIEFQIYPSVNAAQVVFEALATVTAGKNAVNPIEPNFKDEGLIATTQFSMHASNYYGSGLTVINDLFYITQDLILMVHEQEAANPVNWQCKFEKVKLTDSAQAVANYNQATIYE
jgi:hypothetical protein